MPERYADAILDFLSGQDYQPLKPRHLARQLGIGDDEYGQFRQAVKMLRDSGRIVLGAHNAMTLPDMPSRITGFFRANPRGFGFVTPQTPNSHGDLFIPAEGRQGAMNGDLVTARIVSRSNREGKTMLAGQIIQIVQRGQNRYVGELQCANNAWFVLPDGTQMTTPIVIRDVSEAGPKKGDKVVVEIIRYGAGGELPVGVIVESLGPGGELEVETRAVIKAHGLTEEFSPAALADARLAIEEFDDADLSGGRKDITDQTIVTIDPPDARDFDDAISLRDAGGGRVQLGVHIADVSHFVAEGGPLDLEARKRSTSAYFPRKVIPMLPEVLSNGVCSLQENQRRFCISAFITYDRDGKVVHTEFAPTVIRSAKRLTYAKAQAIIDGKEHCEHRVADLLKRMNNLARLIEQRRRKAGMLHLDLPAVELVFDDQNQVADAVPEDNSYTHTLIEMFMVEANEAVGSLLAGLNRPCLRRIHPQPDRADGKQFSAFIRACGHKLPVDMSRHDIQKLLETVKGRPESYAVNLAVLKSFEQAEYSPRLIGHFALASEHYVHFTSPIRRYPDLTIHRLVRQHAQGRLKDRPPEDVSGLVRLAEDCSAAERRAKAAEDELREVLVLLLLKTRVGEIFDGVITGVANFGIFVQSQKFLVEGLIRLEDLGDDWWEVDARMGQVRGERTGKQFRIGDMMTVQIISVDLARRQLNLSPAGQKVSGGRGPEGGGGKSARPHKKSGRDRRKKR
ncbi:MAG: ribonuclease R [Planctomycetes bacterium]|nr:ribonuclease R [Planctomycetota bacterium]